MGLRWGGDRSDSNGIEELCPSLLMHCILYISRDVLLQLWQLQSNYQHPTGMGEDEKHG